MQWPWSQTDFEPPHALDAQLHSIFELPESQTKPAGQTLPHEPQWSAVSAFVSQPSSSAGARGALQSAKPCAHEGVHAPSTHLVARVVLSVEQAWPQAPQFAASLARSAAQPPAPVAFVPPPPLDAAVAPAAPLVDPPVPAELVDELALAVAVELWMFS